MYEFKVKNLKKKNRRKIDDGKGVKMGIEGGGGVQKNEGRIQRKKKKIKEEKGKKNLYCPI